MHVVYTPHHRLHATDGVVVDGHPLGSSEVPARAERILQAIQAARLGPVVEPDDHGLAPLRAVHDPGYLAFLQRAYAESAAQPGAAGPLTAWTFASRHALHRPAGVQGLVGWYAFGWGTPILEGTWQAAYWSAQCALSAAHRVRQGEPAAYALCRPPGHHAAVDLYGGFCYLNNAAIAARYLQRDGGPVAILDVDYHHGNGTQLLFYTDPTVLVCSLHADPDEEYPYYWGAAGETGAGPGAGANHNWPLPRGTAGARYLRALDQALEVVRAFAPRTLVVSLGLDTLAGDPEGGFVLTIDDLHQVACRIAALALPTLIVQEGGYRLDALGEAILAFLAPFAGHPRTA
jgi:acetoin utilization deacetylase AcuC-like enzyme